MTPDVVVDIGNTRIKFGRCGEASGIAELVSHSPDEPESWQETLQAWGFDKNARLAVASVHPGRAERLLAWAQTAGHFAVRIDEHHRLPIRTQVDDVTKVGIDRLLTASAAAHRIPERPCVVVTAGTAVTVDFVSAAGIFAGGAIFPGIGTMVRSLHEHTALLPEVQIAEPVRLVVGKNTTDAIRSGVFWSVVGGISFLAMHGSQTLENAWPKLFLTGGDSHLLDGFFNFDAEIVPTLTLEGIRLAAEALP